MWPSGLGECDGRLKETGGELAATARCRGHAVMLHGHAMIAEVIGPSGGCPGQGW